MSDKGQKVAIITGGSQGIGASLVTAYRRQGWSVVATAAPSGTTGQGGPGSARSETARNFGQGSAWTRWQTQTASHAYIRSLVSNQPVGKVAGPSGTGSAPFSTVPGMLPVTRKANFSTPASS